MKMRFNEYQELALYTLGTHLTREQAILMGGLGLAGESGEVCELLKKRHYHKKDIPDSEIRDELGDVLWYLSLLAAQHGFDLEAVAQRNIEKLRERYPNGFPRIR